MSPSSDTTFQVVPGSSFAASASRQKFSQQPHTEGGTSSVMFPGNSARALYTSSTYPCGIHAGERTHRGGCSRPRQGGPRGAASLSRGLGLTSTGPELLVSLSVSASAGQELKVYSSEAERRCIFRLHLHLSNTSHTFVPSAFLPGE